MYLEITKHTVAKLQKNIVFGDSGKQQKDSLAIRKILQNLEMKVLCINREITCIY